ncbi:heparan-alpha-glucosaminide N-acetyltransferase-like [Corticium candelabrum]|uniref:heparan-alpha-glucosaminide N-acetyltransferase-like n=1 Tax=Corticium candelabrum TaxID=121492 RepID=UPI002E27249D|nr:heparan-alpha-glucosaminide N-acetyltransferase-like [Corticium candelabrum]
MGIMVAMAMFWIVWENFIFKYCKESRVWYQFFGAGLVVRSDLGSPDCEAISERLLSSSTSSRELKQATRRSKPLDAFRGLSLVVMIFVNYGGGGYWFFRLSYWNGLTVADLVFPWFVFILGVSAVISLSNSECHGVSRWSILLKVVRRFIILSVLGLFLNKSSDLATFRIPGVLQRLAVCYLMICLLHLCFSPRPDTTRRAPSRFSICEIRYYLIQWFLALDLVLGYVLITYLVHKSDCPDQYLGPGGKLGDGGKYMNANCTGGAAGYIDELVFSHDHIYQTPTCKKMYETGPYDPEGMLGTLTSIFLSFLGVHAGRIFLLYRDKHQRMIRWTVNGIVFGISGAGLCCFQQNGGLIPINKNLWSVSYTLVMAGISFILLTIFYYVIDIKKWWTGAPFYFLGMNSILVYVGHRMVKGYFPFDWESDLTYVHLMIRNVTGTVLWVAIAAYLHYIKLFVKV